MAANPGTVEQITLILANILRPIEDLLEPEELREFFTELGLRFPPELLDQAGFMGAVQATSASVQQVPELITELLAAIEAEDVPGIVELSGALTDAIQSVITSFSAIQTQMIAVGGSLPGITPEDLSDFTNQLPERLLAYLLFDYLRWSIPRALVFLELFGVIDRVPQRPDSTDPVRPPYDRITLRLNRLVEFVGSPINLLRQLYGWDTPGFDGVALLQRLERTLLAAGVPAAFDGSVAPPTLDVMAFRLLPRTDLDPRGLAIRLNLNLDPQMVTLQLGDWRFDTIFELQAPTGSEITIQPNGTLGFKPPSGSAQGKLSFQARSGGAGQPYLLFGRTGETRLEATELALRAGVDLSWNPATNAARGDFGAEAKVVGGNLVIKPIGADGFLASVLPADGFTAQFDLAVGFAMRRGFYFAGSGMLEVRFPLQLKTPAVELQAMTLRIGASGSTLPISVGASFNVRLGPLVGTVENMGLTGLLSFPGSGGNIGPADVQLRFKPPEGIGLALDAGPVTGGGFLFFDPVQEQYAGGLHLEFEGLTLNAIGLLTTHLPDGSRGFSLLVIVQASGFAPIQLGFGFALTGVGGLLGINRTVAVDVLRAGVRNRTLDAILFSRDDPIARAPQIISTLQTVFPPAVDQYVFGPMAQITWGTPALITIEIALILELPAPLRLIILGRIRTALPDPEQAIISINLDVIGVIDFDRRELSVDASLYDSTVGPFALTGDMAARARWGDNPDFAMALGGFHPAFKAPPGFPELRRLALALSSGNNPRLRMEAYFALTSNTVQVGARLEFYVEAAGFSLEGGLAFDALIQFSPFRILVEIYAHLALKRGRRTLMGLDIHVHLSGPAPWVLWGEARFKIFFISFSIPFRATFGRVEDVPAIERQEVWPKLRDSLKLEGNWSAQLPAECGQLVVLRPETSATEVLVHPLGSLSVSQNLVPLERTLGLFGSVPPKDYDEFAIVGVDGLDIVGPTQQYFAPAQFRKMSDAEKLASPSFERMVSGVRLAPADAIVVGYVQETPLDYEQSVILDVDQPASERLEERYTPGGVTIAALAEHGPAGTAAVREQGRAKFVPPVPGPAVAEPEFVVVTKDTLTPVTIDGLDGSYTAAAERLRRRADRDELQIVRKEEVVLP